MSDSDGNPLNGSQLLALEEAFHQGSAEASAALGRWIGRPSVVELDQLQQLPLEEAPGVLAAGEEAICFCSLQIEGPLNGEMILAFDDAAGFSLADMLLDQSPGTSSDWGEVEESAALETANIVCSAYLNALSRAFVGAAEGSSLLPTPPAFCRDFAESLLQFVLMGQAQVSDRVLFALSRFEIEAIRVNWTLLLVPDAESMSRLPTLLAGGNKQ